MEILNSENQIHRTKLDPRTKLILLIAICFLVIGGEGGGITLVIKPLLTAVPLTLLFLDGKRKLTVISGIIYILCYLEKISLYH